MEDKMHKVRIKMKGCRAVCNAMVGVFTDEQRQRIIKTLESRGGGSKKTPKAPFGERTGEYDTYL